MQLSAADLFKYVWPFSEYQTLKGYNVYNKDLNFKLSLALIADSFFILSTVF